MPCPDEPTIAVLVPKVDLGETCPTACTGNPAETCFYDPAGCSGGVDTLGCGAGGYANCRFCGFEPFGPCGQQQQPPQVMAEVMRDVNRLLQGYPTISEGTRVQADVTYTLELEVDLRIAGGGDGDRTTDEEHSQRLLSAFRAVACGTAEVAGACLTQLESMTATLVNATGVGRRRMQTEGGRLLQTQLKSSTATPLPPALVAVALNATTFNEAIAAWLRANPPSPGAVSLSVQRRAAPVATLAVDVRMLRFSDVAAERRDLEEVAKQVALALQDDFILNVGSQALAAGPTTSSRVASELVLLLVSLLLLCGCLGVALVRHRRLRRAKVNASLAGGEPVAGFLKAPKSSKRLLTPSQLRSSAVSGEDALEDEGSSQRSEKGADGVVDVDGPDSPMRTTGSAKLLAATLPMRSTKRMSVQPGSSIKGARAQIQPEGPPEGPPEGQPGAKGTPAATPQRRASGLLASLSRGVKGQGRAKPIFTRFDDGATVSGGLEEGSTSQDGSAPLAAPPALPPSKWARAGIEARRQSAVQRAQNAEISTFGKGALKKSKSRRGLPMGVSALVEDEEEQVDAQPMSHQARVTRL